MSLLITVLPVFIKQVTGMITVNKNQNIKNSLKSVSNFRVGGEIQVE